MNARAGLRYRSARGDPMPHYRGHSRRDFLAGLAGAAAAAPLIWPARGRAQVASPTVRIIDTHHHIYPPKFTRDNLQRIVEDIGGCTCLVLLKLVAA
jgi:hypothetical protein